MLGITGSIPLSSRESVYVTLCVMKHHQRGLLVLEHAVELPAAVGFHYSCCRLPKLQFSCLVCAHTVHWRRAVSYIVRFGGPVLLPVLFNNYRGVPSPSDT